MRAARIEGAPRSRRFKTTRPDPTAARHPDLVKWELMAAAPNRLWVIDLTSVPTWAGVDYRCFIIDAFSRIIVGWRCAARLRTDVVLDAIEMARWGRGAHHHDLRCNSDEGSQLISIRGGERLAEIRAIPSIGAVGDSYHYALAQAVNGYHEPELARGDARPGSLTSVEDLELAILGWVNWHDTRRLHGYLGDIPPAKFEHGFCAGQTDHDGPVGIKDRESISAPRRCIPQHIED